MLNMDWKFWLPFIVGAIGSLYQVLGYYLAKRQAGGQGAFVMKRPHVVAGIFMVLTWAAIAFYYYDYSGRVREYTPATPCQLRLSPSERDKILDFLNKNEAKRGNVQKVEIVVERGREDDCLYAQDLRQVFKSSAWGSAEIIAGNPQGNAVWFENSVGDELARTFWKQTLCGLSQDFYHEDQADVALKNKWMFFIGDTGGGVEGYSPEVTCPNKRTSRESLPQPGNEK